MSALGLILLILGLIALGVAAFYLCVCLQSRPPEFQVKSVDPEEGRLLRLSQDLNANHETASDSTAPPPPEGDGGVGAIDQPDEGGKAFPPASNDPNKLGFLTKNLTRHTEEIPVHHMDRSPRSGKHPQARPTPDERCVVINRNPTVQEVVVPAEDKDGLKKLEAKLTEKLRTNETSVATETETESGSESESRDSTGFTSRDSPGAQMDNGGNGLRIRSQDRKRDPAGYGWANDCEMKTLYPDESVVLKMASVPVGTARPEYPTLPVSEGQLKKVVIIEPNFPSEGIGAKHKPGADSESSLSNCTDEDAGGGVGLPERRTSATKAGAGAKATDAHTDTDSSEPEVTTYHVNSGAFSGQAQILLADTVNMNSFEPRMIKYTPLSRSDPGFRIGILSEDAFAAQESEKASHAEFLNDTLSSQETREDLPIMREDLPAKDGNEATIPDIQKLASADRFARTDETSVPDHQGVALNDEATPTSKINKTKS